MKRLFYVFIVIGTTIFLVTRDWEKIIDTPKEGSWPFLLISGGYLLALFIAVVIQSRKENWKL